MYVINHEELKLISSKIFESAGATVEESNVVSNHLVENNLVGHDSHGVQFIPPYVELLQNKHIVTNAKFEIVRESEITATIDGGNGFGQVVATKAMEIAIKKAKKSDMSIVTARNHDHIGRLGDYSMMAVKEDMIGITFAKSDPVMAPLGGKSRIIGNNPFSFGFPAKDENPILQDFATSTVAGGKCMLAASKGESIPEGWTLDPEGNATTDPNDFVAGGALLPFTQHKGWAMGVVVEVLCGILNGAGVLDEYKMQNASTMIVLNIEAFMPINEFKLKVDNLIRKLKNSPKAPGVKEILVPGDPEFRAKETRLKEGIPLPLTTWNAIKEIAKNLKVDIAPNN